MATSPCISPSLIVSALEFRKMVTSADVTEIYKLLVDHPTLFPHYLHFSALSRTLKHQEIFLKQTEEELDMAFRDMTDHDFYDVFAFFIARKLNEQQQSSPHNPLCLDDPLPTDVPLCSPLSVTIIFIRCHHPLTPRLLSQKQSPHTHHEPYQDVRWDKGSPPSTESEQDTVAIAENRGTTLRNVLIFIVSTAMVKDT